MGEGYQSKLWRRQSVDVDVDTVDTVADDDRSSCSCSHSISISIPSCSHYELYSFADIVETVTNF